MAQREGDRHIAADGKSEDIDVGQLERTYEGGNMIDHRLDGIRRLAAGAGDARVVEDGDKRSSPPPVRR